MNPNDELTIEQWNEKVQQPDFYDRAIVLYKDDDGNWRGVSKKNGQFIQARQGDPGTVLQLLITHGGNDKTKKTD